MTIVQVNFSTTREVCSIKRPSHVKLMLANSCWETQIGVCERHNNLRKVGEQGGDRSEAWDRETMFSQLAKRSSQNVGQRSSS